MRFGGPDLALLGITLLALPGGLLLRGFDHGELATLLWNGSALLAAGVLLVEILIRLRRREIGVDLIVLLAIAAAVLFEQSLVAALVALMLASGRALESYSEHRAERELRHLIDRAPRMAWRYRNTELEQVSVDLVQTGDRLLLRLGEVIPVDGMVLDNMATLDESALTGEPLPVRRAPWGSVAQWRAERRRAVRDARQPPGDPEHLRGHSADGRGRAPFVRLADRYALLLIPFTLTLAGLA